MKKCYEKEKIGKNYITIDSHWFCLQLLIIFIKLYSLNLLICLLIKNKYMDPFAYLQEIKLVGMLVLGFFCYRRLKKVYNEPI